MLDEIRIKLDIPTQSCVLAHVTTTLELIRQGAPVDLVFQSIAGTEAANKSFGIDLALLHEAREAALSLRRGTRRRQRDVFRDRPGQRAVGRRASRRRPADAARRAPMRWRGAFKPLLVNTVVGFIGPEYLFDGKQIIRAGLEDHFCGKLMGVPMGVDVCYTNHAEADQDDMDALLTLLVAAGVNFVMGVPGADDIMLGYQSTSFHDALAMRDLFGRAARAGIRGMAAPAGPDWTTTGRIRPRELPSRFRALLPAAMSRCPHEPPAAAPTTRACGPACAG